MENEIINVLDNIDRAVDIIEICDLLNIKDKSNIEKLNITLLDMEKKGIIHVTHKNRYILLKNCKSLRKGVIDVNKSGNAFCILDDHNDVFIDKKNLNGSIEGDSVIIDTFNRRGKLEGSVIKILDRKYKTIVGRVSKLTRKLVVIPDDNKINITINVLNPDFPNLVDGHKVLIILKNHIKKDLYEGVIDKIIGHVNDPDIDILSIAYSHGITLDISEESKQELLSIPESVEDKDLVGRVDLTNQVIFTIDGDDTKDIDDAISVSYDNVNKIYTLGVHIADVTNYVTPNTALYKDAYLKGTSSYLADKVLPMLPHELSNGICSLNPGVLRLAISCVMKIDETGKIIDHDIFKSVIKSRKQMTYKCVNKIIMEGVIPEGYEEYKDDLLLMNELHKILRKRKVNNGYIEFGIDEIKIKQDETGKCIDILKRVQLEGEKIIEDFMIAANETVAEHIYNMDLPFIYRVHGTPRTEKIEDFVNLLKVLNISCNTKNISISSKGMQDIIESIKDHPAFKTLSSMLLRCMQKAIYSTNNIGHYGLGLKNYTHFTSPIRRFPDLMVHQLLKTYLFNNDLNSSTIDFYSQYLIEVAEYSSEREQEAQAAEREVDDMKMAEYMENHIGETFEGIVSSITNFGMFVELPNTIEGLIRMEDLVDDFYYFDDVNLQLIGKRTGRRFKMSDKVKIKVSAASKREKTIDFQIVGMKSNKKKKKTVIINKRRDKKPKQKFKRKRR